MKLKACLIKRQNRAARQNSAINSFRLVEKLLCEYFESIPGSKAHYSGLLDMKGESNDGIGGMAEIYERLILSAQKSRVQFFLLTLFSNSDSVCLEKKGIEIEKLFATFLERINNVQTLLQKSFPKNSQNSNLWNIWHNTTLPFQLCLMLHHFSKLHQSIENLDKKKNKQN